MRNPSFSIPSVSTSSSAMFRYSGDDLITSLRRICRIISNIWKSAAWAERTSVLLFPRVEALQKSREFTDLSGILVFTDGAPGSTPDRKPDARCILVFLDRQYDPANLPRWAEILVLGGTATERNEY